MTPYTISDAENGVLAALTGGDPAHIAAALGAYERAAGTEHPSTSGAPSLHAAALWYAEQGLAVFPLTPGTKIPFRRSRGCKDATTDADTITAWWTETPEANIGIATGDLVDVIDVDGPEGVVSWARYADDLPPILGRVSTPRPGGNHLYVAAVPGRGNKAGLLPKVDYRGAGGYVVAPPSVITTGEHPGAYVWHRPVDVAALALVGAA